MTPTSNRRLSSRVRSERDMSQVTLCRFAGEPSRGNREVRVDRSLVVVSWLAGEEVGSHPPPAQCFLHKSDKLGIDARSNADEMVIVVQASATVHVDHHFNCGSRRPAPENRH